MLQVIMVKLPESLKALDSPSFAEVFKNEVANLKAGSLPLQECITQGSFTNEGDVSVVVLSISKAPDVVSIKAGIFYSSVIAGCSCADDPTPVDELTEYCELLFDINRETSEVVISLLSD